MLNKTTFSLLILVVAAAVFTSFAQAKQPSSVSPVGLSRAYLCFEGETAEEVMSKANEAGARGWKLVSAAPGARGSIWCFEQLGAMRPAAP